MKKLTAILAAMLFAVTVYAGPYLFVEQNPVAAEASLTVGWDFLSLRINEGTLMGGDFFVANRNIWVYPSPWTFGGEISLDWLRKAEQLGPSVRTMSLVVASEVDVSPVGWPGFIGLDSWETSLQLTAYPNAVMLVYGRISLVYDAVGAWSFQPVIGIECRW